MSSVINTVFLDSGASTGGIILFLYLAILFLGFYFLGIRPNKKKQRALDLMLSELTVGDCVLTTSGFYGVVIDVMAEVVIVEFGNNRNCRITMKKEAILEVEKADNTQ